MGWTTNGNTQGTITTRNAKFCDVGHFVTAIQWKEHSNFGLTDLQFECNDGKGTRTITRNENGNWNDWNNCTSGFEGMRGHVVPAWYIVNVEMASECFGSQDLRWKKSNRQIRRNTKTQEKNCPEGQKIVGYQIKDQQNRGIVSYDFYCGKFQYPQGIAFILYYLL